MKKIIKLTESDLARIVKRVLREQQAVAPTQGTTPQGTAPGRVYQISDFTSYQPNAQIATLAEFVSKYRPYIQSRGKDSDMKSILDAYYTNPNEFCQLLNGGQNVVTPIMKKGATQDILDFSSPPIKFICDKTNKYIMTALITKNDAKIIANLGGGGVVKKTYEKDANNLYKTFA